MLRRVFNSPALGDETVFLQNSFLSNQLSYAREAASNLLRVKFELEFLSKNPNASSTTGYSHYKIPKIISMNYFDKVFGLIIY